MKRIIGFGAALVVVGLAGANVFVPGEEPPATTPVPLEAASPFRYPISLWDQRVEGETVLMVRVTPQGAVDTAYVLTTSGHPAFDSAALTGSSALRFQPGVRGDEPVASWARLPVRFRMPRDATQPGA